MDECSYNPHSTSLSHSLLKQNVSMQRSSCCYSHPLPLIQNYTGHPVTGGKPATLPVSTQFPNRTAKSWRTPVVWQPNDTDQFKPAYSSSIKFVRNSPRSMDKKLGDCLQAYSAKFKNIYDVYWGGHFLVRCKCDESMYISLDSIQYSSGLVCIDSRSMRIETTGDR